MLLIAVGSALLVAGAVMTVRALAGRRQIRRELDGQRIVFPAAERLPPSLARYAHVRVRTGGQARAFADMIGANLARAAAGRTYAEVAEEAHAAGADEGLLRLRETVFMGQTLRASLLGAYQAWQVTVLALTVGALLAAVGLVFVMLAMG